MNILYKKEIPVKYSADVLIAGGGPAGAAAAIMCSRLVSDPSRIMLVEQSGTFGGASTLALVPEIMNFDDGVNFLCGGIGREIHDALFGAEYGKRKWYNVRTEELKCLYDRMIVDSGITFRFYSRVTDVITDVRAVTHAVISGPDGVYAVSAKCFIDCTGTGSLCSLAGAECEFGDERGNTMSATLCSVWGGVDFDRKQYDSARLREAYNNGVFSQYDMLLPGIKATFPEVGVGGGNVGHCFEIDDRDDASLTNAMIRARRLLTEYETYYKSYVAGCERAVLLNTANYLGIRESRRVKCEKMLCAEDFSADNTFDDEIGRYSYPIDIHPMTPDEEGMREFGVNVAKRHGSGESYSIPYRCLIPVTFDNVFVAGRCIGADHAMQASVRVIPCCYITGQAAGAAAAVCVNDGCTNKNADPEKIRRMLAGQGAYITNLKAD